MTTTEPTTTPAWLNADVLRPGQRERVVEIVEQGTPILEQLTAWFRPALDEVLAHTSRLEAHGVDCAAVYETVDEVSGMKPLLDLMHNVYGLVEHFEMRKPIDDEDVARCGVDTDSDLSADFVRVGGPRGADQRFGCHAVDADPDLRLAYRQCAARACQTRVGQHRDRDRVSAGRDPVLDGPAQLRRQLRPSPFARRIA